jgi:hypothetical protein
MGVTPHVGAKAGSGHANGLSPSINWEPKGVAGAGRTSVRAKAHRAPRGFMTGKYASSSPKVGRLGLRLRLPIAVLENLHLLERD